MKSLLSTLLLLLGFSMTYAQQAGDERVICAEPVPSGWFVTEIGSRCNDKPEEILDNYSRRIKYLVGMPTGSVVQTCGSIRRPEGWINTSIALCKEINSTLYYARDIKKIEGLTGGTVLEIVDDVIPEGWIKTGMKSGPIVGSSAYDILTMTKIDGIQQDSIEIVDAQAPQGWIPVDVGSFTFGTTVFTTYRILKVAKMNVQKKYTIYTTNSPSGWMTTALSFKSIGSSSIQGSVIEHHLSMPIGTEKICFNSTIPLGWIKIGTEHIVYGTSSYEVAKIRKTESIITGEITGVLPKIGSPYTISGSVTIPQNQTLTIEPGVHIQSKSYSDRVYINGTLIAQGTATDSIRFIGLQPGNITPGITHAGALEFDAGSRASVLDHVAIDHWGETAYLPTPGAVVVHTSDVTISNTSIRNSKLNGIYVDGNAAPRIHHVNFEATPFGISGIISNFFNTIGNRNAGMTLRGYPAMSTNSMLPKQGANSFYQLEASLTIEKGLSLEIKPGVEIRSASSGNVITVNGTLIAKGTAADSIKFVSLVPRQVNSNYSHAGAIYFAAGSTQSELEYISMNYWGERPPLGLWARRR